MDNGNLLAKQKILNELVENKLLNQYIALKRKALLVKLKVVEHRIKHLNKELKKG